jgi:hypothetical protein
MRKCFELMGILGENNTNEWQGKRHFDKDFWGMMPYM